MSCTRSMGRFPSRVQWRLTRKFSPRRLAATEWQSVNAGTFLGDLHDLVLNLREFLQGFLTAFHTFLSRFQMHCNGSNASHLAKDSFFQSGCLPVRQFESQRRVYLEVEIYMDGSVNRIGCYVVDG